MEQLISTFIDRYLSRQEVLHRLPLSVSIAEFWPKLAAERRRRAVELPLFDQRGNPFWFVVNATIEAQCDRVSELARREAFFSGPEFEMMFEDAVIDEAAYSSIIEGAMTSRESAARFIHGRRPPRNRSEQMVKNNYDALGFVLEHLEEEISEETLVEIAKIVTRGASDVRVAGYRAGPVYVTGREGVVYTPPAAEQVPEMMGRLIRFIRESELHPLLKACAAHFYFVYVHPFPDGNGRTARALSYMLLLKAGYDFFRYFSISGLVAEERGRYYRAMLNVEQSDSDMTYFIDFYSDIMARAVSRMEDHIKYRVRANRRLAELEALEKLNERQLKGAKWLLEARRESVTVETWRKKYRITTETARRDLLALRDCGLLERTIEGKRAVFRILREP